MCTILISKALGYCTCKTRDHTDIPATHTFIHNWNEPSCLYSQPQSITALWPVLISHPADSTAL